MGRELLDDMARLSGCLYLSDLRTEQGRMRLRQSMGHVDHRRYPVKEWQDAIMYVTQKRPPIGDAKDGYRYLWDWLNGKGMGNGGKTEETGSLSAADL